MRHLCNLMISRLRRRLFLLEAKGSAVASETANTGPVSAESVGQILGYLMVAWRRCVHGTSGLAYASRVHAVNDEIAARIADAYDNLQQLLHVAENDLALNLWGVENPVHLLTVSAEAAHENETGHSAVPSCHGRREPSNTID